MRDTKDSTGTINGFTYTRETGFRGTIVRLTVSQRTEIRIERTLRFNSPVPFPATVNWSACGDQPTGVAFLYASALLAAATLAAQLDGEHVSTLVYDSEDEARVEAMRATQAVSA